MRRGLVIAATGRPIAVNLSAHSVTQTLIAALAQGATLGGLDPANVTFEITETAALTNLDAARQFVEEVGGLGFSVALDDFGTGFGSFTYLKHIPARYLKIDMEFVRGLLGSPVDQEVVRSIVGIARSLGKLTIAGGRGGRRDARAAARVRGRLRPGIRDRAARTVARVTAGEGDPELVVEVLLEAPDEVADPALELLSPGLRSRVHVAGDDRLVQRLDLGDDARERVQQVDLERADEHPHLPGEPRELARHARQAGRGDDRLLVGEVGVGGLA